MIFGRRKIKKRIFPFNRRARVDNVRPKSRTLKVGIHKLKVFECGDQTVVYDGDRVLYNSVIDDISYPEWEKKYKIFTVN